jgi:hypothetical protein
MTGARASGAGAKGQPAVRTVGRQGRRATWQHKLQRQQVRNGMLSDKAGKYDQTAALKTKIYVDFNGPDLLNS